MEGCLYYIRKVKKNQALKSDHSMIHMCIYMYFVVVCFNLIVSSLKKKTRRANIKLLIVANCDGMLIIFIASLLSYVF